jgi:hypothetical protein
MQEVQESIPSAGYGPCMRYLNNEIISLATRFKLKARTHAVDSISGQMWYSLSDLDSDMGLNKLFRVSLLNSDDEYELIRRLQNPKAIKLWDRV